MNTQANIHRSTHAANFVILPNAILNNFSLSGNAKALLSYLLSKPPHWKIRITDLKNVLKVGRDRVYRYLHELIDAGYAKMTLIQKGVRWEFFDTPQPSQTSETAKPEPKFHLPERQHAERQQALEKNEIPFLESNEEQQHSVTIIEPVQPASAPSVVVSDGIGQSIDPIVTEEIEKLPIKQSQRKAAVNVLSGLTAEQIMVILAVFSQALVKGGINNNIGYLVQLKKAALNGTLSPISAPQSLTAAQRIAKQEQARRDDTERHKISNDQWAMEMINKLGMEAALKIMPWYRPQ